MNDLESCAWASFIVIMKKFLTNPRAKNYEKL